MVRFAGETDLGGLLAEKINGPLLTEPKESQEMVVQAPEETLHKQSGFINPVVFLTCCLAIQLIVHKKLDVSIGFSTLATALYVSVQAALAGQPLKAKSTDYKQKLSDLFLDEENDNVTSPGVNVRR